MVPLLLAAGLTLAPPALVPRIAPLRPACADYWRVTPAKGPGPARFSRLGDLPKADLQLTVLRAVDGCPVSTTIRYAVEGDGRFAKPGKD